MLRKFLYLIACVVLIAPRVDAQDRLPNWTTWRGPNENGTSENANPPVEWSLTKNIKWKIPIPGKGKSTPIVWKDQVIILTAVPTDRTKEGAAAPAPAGRGGGAPAPNNYHRFMVMSFDRATGAKQWEKLVREDVPHEGGHPTNSFSSSSALTDGERIYAFFGSHGMHCLDMKGNILWQKDLGKMTTLLAFGEGATPALAEGTLVIPWDHETDSYLIALDAATGQQKWKVPREKGGDRGNTTWGTPLIVKHKGRNQVIVNGRIVRSYDLADGREIWRCGGQASNPIPTPIVYGDHVICTTGYNGFAVYSISLDSEGDVTQDAKNVAWKRSDTGSYVASPVLYKNQLYLSKGLDNIAFALDAKTGENVFSQFRLPELKQIYSSPVAAADRIYFTDRNGKTVVLKHGSTPEVIAINSLEETVDSSLALVGNTIFARGENTLFCISES